MYCTNCGKELPDNSRFCPNCGNMIKNDTANYSDENRKKLFTKELWLTLLLGISVSEFYYIIYYVLLKIQAPQTSAVSFYLKFVFAITLSLALSLKYSMPYLTVGISQIYQTYQLRGIIGTSLGAMVALWRILSAMGQSLDMASTAKSLLGESSFFITLCILLFSSARKENTIRVNVVSLLYLAGGYNLLFWLMVLIGGICDGMISDGILSLFALVILFLPLVIALIAAICFYRCKRG